MTSNTIPGKHEWVAARYAAIRLQAALEKPTLYSETSRACMEDYIRAVEAVWQKYQALQVDCGEITYRD